MDGLKQVMEVKSKVVLPFLVPQVGNFTLKDQSSQRAVVAWGRNHLNMSEMYYGGPNVL